MKNHRAWEAKAARMTYLGRPLFTFLRCHSFYSAFSSCFMPLTRSRTARSLKWVVLGGRYVVHNRFAVHPRVHPAAFQWNKEMKSFPLQTHAFRGCLPPYILPVVISTSSSILGWIASGFCCIIVTTLFHVSWLSKQLFWYRLILTFNVDSGNDCIMSDDSNSTLFYCFQDVK